MPLFNVLRYPEINFCLIFSVKLENGHDIGPKSIVSINGKIKKSLCHAWSLFFDARAGWILLINALKYCKIIINFMEFQIYKNLPPPSPWNVKHCPVCYWVARKVTQHHQPRKELPCIAPRGFGSPCDLLQETLLTFLKLVKQNWLFCQLLVSYDLSFIDLTSLIYTFRYLTKN